MNASWVTKSVVTVPSASICQVLINVYARTDTVAIRTMGSVPRHRRDVPMTTNARLTKSACSLGSACAHHRSTQIL